MITLKLTIRKTMPRADGTYNIKVQLSHRRRTTYIPTRFNVRDVEWSNGRVVKRDDATVINKKLSVLLTGYYDIIDEHPIVESMEVSEIREFILLKSQPDGSKVKAYIEKMIDRLDKEGRKSYATGMRYTLKQLTEAFGENLIFEQVTSSLLERWEKWFLNHGYSLTTINMRMTHLKAVLNAAVNDEIVEYKVFPFRRYRLPSKNVRDLCISVDELRKIRDTEFEGVSKRRMTVARDLFMLSFYCAGINLTDLLSADLSGDVLSFVRKKTAAKKRGEKLVSISIQPEAKEIIQRYLVDGRLDFGYKYRDYEQFRSFVTKSLNRMGEELGFEKKLTFYSARKTFCQIGYELGVPLHILEYAIGHTIKEENSRPIFDYIRVMRNQADAAIRSVIDATLCDEM